MLLSATFIERHTGPPVRKELISAKSASGKCLRCPFQVKRLGQQPKAESIADLLWMIVNLPEFQLIN